MSKEAIQLTRDLVLESAWGLWGIMREYPYQYREELDDGTVRFIFSEKPINEEEKEAIIPTHIPEDMSKKLSNHFAGVLSWMETIGKKEET